MLYGNIIQLGQIVALTHVVSVESLVTKRIIAPSGRVLVEVKVMAQLWRYRE